MAVTQQSPTGPQLMFLAKLETPVTDVTGDATSYTVVWDTIAVNVGTCLAGTGIFTVPATGIYEFHSGLSPIGLDASYTALQWRIVNTTVASSSYALYAGGTTQIMALPGTLAVGPIFVSPGVLTAGNAIHCAFDVSGGTKTVGLQGYAGGLWTWWACYKVT